MENLRSSAPGPLPCGDTAVSPAANRMDGCAVSRLLLALALSALVHEPRLVDATSLPAIDPFDDFLNALRSQELSSAPAAAPSAAGPQAPGELVDVPTCVRAATTLIHSCRLGAASAF